MNTKRLTFNAVLAAMCAALGTISLDFGNLKLTFESFPVIVAALLFGPVDAMLVGGIGTLLYQVLRYGITVTTPLWILPYILCGLVVGLYAKWHRFDLDKIRMGIIIFTGSILIFLLNTLVLYVDSKVYGYYSFVYIFGTIVPRTLICLAKAAVFTAVMPVLLDAARKVLK
ncbi:MAG: ECF transporter S component [Oscillospiraceae bacterium]|nr:ECF transporter S component [Oscillospiraceae bacterium]